MIDLEKLTKKAEQGDAKSQFDLGFLYYRGMYVPQNIEKAVNLLNAAIKQGYVMTSFCENCDCDCNDECRDVGCTGRRNKICPKCNGEIMDGECDCDT